MSLWALLFQLLRKWKMRQTIQVLPRKSSGLEGGKKLYKKLQLIAIS